MLEIQLLALKCIQMIGYVQEEDTFFFIVTIKRNFKFYLELKHYQ